VTLIQLPADLRSMLTRQQNMFGYQREQDW